MAAAYDSYDYPSYWKNREYEHEAEIIALNSFLKKIPKIKNIIDIGSGFGRLTPSYLHRANKVTLVDPSSKLLKIAKEKIPHKKVKIVHSTIKNLKGKIRNNSADLIIMVRVLHHIPDLENTIKIVKKLLNKNGYFILEFANKSHLKATAKEFLKGNFTFPLEIFPQDKRSLKSKSAKTIPFVNYHPDQIKQKLISHGFSIVEVRSVSNIRSPLLKKYISKDVLLSIESQVQTVLSHFNFGPSIFILAKNTK